jgi:TolB protein
MGSGRIAFTRYDAAQQRFDIYSLDVSSGEDALLRQNGSQPAFHSDGRQLVFRNHDPSSLGLAILDLARNEVKDLTAHAEDATPAWSAPAQQIVFASNKHGDRKWRVYAISSGQVRGEGTEWAFGQMPAWSPEGSQIVYHGCDERGDNCGVWIMNAGGVELQRLTTDPSDTAPSWSPTGAQVAFISARGGNWDLFLADVATRQELRLTDLPSMEVAPAWSPDGARLAFLSNSDGPWGVYILELASGQIRRVAATGDAPPDSVNQRLSWVR